MGMGSGGWVGGVRKGQGTWGRWVWVDGWVQGWEVGGSRVSECVCGEVCGSKVGVGLGVGSGQWGGVCGVCGRRCVWVGMGESKGVGTSINETTPRRNEKREIHASPH